MAVKNNRSVIVYILLSIITFGIYSFYFIHKWAKDVNEICAGDGKETAGLLKYIIFSLITCGFYSLFWVYNLGNRLHENGPKYERTISENGTTILLWLIIGSLLCGIGSIVAYHLLMRNTNVLADAYIEKSVQV